MNRILHIVASPRGEASRTNALWRTLEKRIRAAHPKAVLEEIHLFRETLPEMAGETVSGKYFLMGGKEIPEELKPKWREVENHINRFLAADTIIISTPMWNFGMPYRLKHYFDVILQPRYLFRYTDKGVEGLAKGRRVIVLSTRGGDYSENSPMKSYDHLEPHLRTILGFIGITDLTIVNGQPMDSGSEEVYKKALAEGIARVESIPL